MSKKFHHSYEVCSCKHVILGEIIYAIKENKAKSLEDISAITDAGSSCGCCKGPEYDFGEDKKELYITQILGKFLK